MPSAGECREWNGTIQKECERVIRITNLNLNDPEQNHLQII